MRRLLSLVLAAGLTWAADSPDKDPILRSMIDEMARMRLLTIGATDRPYYAEYMLEDAQLYAVTASLGGLLNSSGNHVQVPWVRIRVGGYDFDNMNFLLSDFAGEGANEAWPIDNDYAVLRQAWWLATDRAFKAAVQVMARKRAAMQAINQGEKLNDFAKAEPYRFLPAFTVHPIDEKPWPDRVRRLSSVFLGYPEVAQSAVEFSATVSTARYVNSEGSLQRYPDNLDQLRILASAMSPDGMEIRHGRTLLCTESRGLPAEAELQKEVREVAETMRALVRAPMGEDYAGPVVFEGYAAAQLFAQVLGSNLAVVRMPLHDPGRSLPLPMSELEGRIGSRILPDWVDVTDEPGQQSLAGEPLAGHYEVDLEGVPAKPVSLVEKGVLKNYLLTRQPVRGFEGSNGHARLPGMFGARAARFSNLFIKVSGAVPEAELKKKLIEMCRQRGKPYGLLVRRLDFPSEAGPGEIRRIATALMQSGGSMRIVSPPVAVYKVFPDGREELVRGMRFRSLPVRALKDLVAAGDRMSVLNYLDNGAPLAMAGATSNVVACSVISPSVLLDDVDMERAREEVATPPLVPPPPLQAAP